MVEKEIWHKKKTNHRIISIYDDRNATWRFNYRSDMVKVMRVLGLALKFGMIGPGELSFTEDGDAYSLNKFIIDMKRDPCLMSAPVPLRTQ